MKSYHKQSQLFHIVLQGTQPKTRNSQQRVCKRSGDSCTAERGGPRVYLLNPRAQKPPTIQTTTRNKTEKKKQPTTKTNQRSPQTTNTVQITTKQIKQNK